MVKQVDRLALHIFANRSVIIRQALLTFINLPANKVIASPDNTAFTKMYEAIKDDYPDLRPEEKDLIKFFYEVKMKALDTEEE